MNRLVEPFTLRSFLFGGAVSLLRRMTTVVILSSRAPHPIGPLDSSGMQFVVELTDSVTLFSLFVERVSLKDLSGIDSVIGLINIRRTSFSHELAAEGYSERDKTHVLLCTRSAVKWLKQRDQCLATVVSNFGGEKPLVVNSVR